MLSLSTIPIIPTRTYQLKIWLSLLTIDCYYNDIYPHIINLWRGHPPLRGFMFLGPNTKIKDKIKEGLPFDVWDDEKHLSVRDFEIQTNNIYIHSYGDKNSSITIYRNISNNVFEAIDNLIKLPFYFKWLGYSSGNFEISGGYNSFSENSLERSMRSLSVGSTLVITATTNHPVFRPVNDEAFLKSFAPLNTNPYIRFIRHIVKNPNNNMFALNVGSEIKTFKVNIDHLQNFSDSGIMARQQEQIQSFIFFFKNVTDTVFNRDVREFSSLISKFSRKNFDVGLWYANVQDTRRYKELLLLNYITKDNAQKVQKLLAIGVDVHTRSMGGVTPLCIAACWNNVGMMRLLIDGGATIDNKNNNILSPLRVAVKNNALDTAEFLLQLGMDSEVRDYNGNTLLIRVSSKGYTEMASLLIRFSADVNAENNQKQTPLTVASAKGHTEIVAQLLEMGADRRHIDGDGHTGFFWAALYKHLDIVQLFFPTIKKANNTHCIEGDVSLIDGVLGDGHESFETIVAINNIHSLIEKENENLIQKVTDCLCDLYELDFEMSYLNLSEICGLCLTL